MTEWDRAYMNARRHPRTLAEAFGPYTTNDIEPMREPRDYSTTWWWAMWAVAAVTVILILTTA